MEADLAVRGNEDHLGPRARRVGEHVSTLPDAACGGVLAAIQGWQGLARERQHGGWWRKCMT